MKLSRFIESFGGPPAGGTPATPTCRPLRGHDLGVGAGAGEAETEEVLRGGEEASGEEQRVVRDAVEGCHFRND